MKHEILILGVVGLLICGFAKADVDKVVVKVDQYNCKNSDVGTFKMSANQVGQYKIEFLESEFNAQFQNAGIELKKFEKSDFLLVSEFEISKNTQVVANLIIAESKVQSGFRTCDRSTRAPCDFPIYEIEINAELTVDQMNYDFVCSQN